MRDMDVIKQWTNTCAHISDVEYLEKLIARVEQLEKGMESLLRVTGQARHYPIFYEDFVLRTARKALAEEDGE